MNNISSSKHHFNSSSPSSASFVTVVSIDISTQQMEKDPDVRLRQYSQEATRAADQAEWYLNLSGALGVVYVIQKIFRPSHSSVSNIFGVAAVATCIGMSCLYGYKEYQCRQKEAQVAKETIFQQSIQ